MSLFLPFSTSLDQPTRQEFSKIHHGVLSLKWCQGIPLLTCTLLIPSPYQGECLSFKLHSNVTYSTNQHANILENNSSIHG